MGNCFNTRCAPQMTDATLIVRSDICSDGTYTVPRRKKGLGAFDLTPCFNWLPGPDSNQRPSG
jgi:hypothetical protein